MANRSHFTEAEQAAAVARWNQAANDDQRRAVADELGVAVSTILRWRTVRKKPPLQEKTGAEGADAQTRTRFHKPRHAISWTTADDDALWAWISEGRNGDDCLSLDKMLLIQEVKKALRYRDDPSEALLSAVFDRGCEIGEELKNLPTPLSLGERSKIVGSYIASNMPWPRSIQQVRRFNSPREERPATAAEKARIRQLVRDCPPGLILEYRQAVAVHKEMLKHGGTTQSTTADIAAAKDHFLSA